MSWEAIALLIVLLAAAALLLTKIGKVLWTALFVLLGGYLAWIYTLNTGGSESDASPFLGLFQTFALVGSVASFGLAGTIASGLALQFRVERLERMLRERQPTERDDSPSPDRPSPSGIVPGERS
jgi:hypothetical protein